MAKEVNKESLTVLDRTPVQGDGTAIQTYLDLSLDKNDIVDAIITQQVADKEIEKDKISDRLWELDSERRDIKKAHKIWIKSKFDEKYSVLVEGVKELMGSEGSYNYETSWKVEYGYCSITFNLDRDTASFSIQHQELNPRDYPHAQRLREIKEEYRDLEHRADKLRGEIQRIEGGGKRVRLDMATQILKNTEQGKKLLEAMTIGRLAGTVKKQLKKKR